MNDETGRFDPNDIMQNKGMACLSYLSVLVVIPLLVKPTSPYVRFHVNQGLVFLIITIIGSIAGRILRWIPFVGWAASSIIGIAILVLMIMGLVNSLGGRAVRLPIIGNIDLYR